MKKVIVVNVDHCLGCRSCQIACAVAHSRAKTLVGAMREEPRPTSRVHIEPVDDVAVPLQCRHCEDAPCVAVCPTHALSRVDENSPVLVDPDLCIGCRWCIHACPFGVIRMDREGRAVIKCDLCHERLAAGELPACVEACPVHALEYREVDEIAQSKRTAAARKIVIEVKGEGAGAEES